MALFSENSYAKVSKTWKLTIKFSKFHSRYQNVHIRQNQCWFQNFPNPTDWATIRLQNRAQATPAMCPILWLNCGQTRWTKKVLKTPFFIMGEKSTHIRVKFKNLTLIYVVSSKLTLMYVVSSKQTLKWGSYIHSGHFMKWP